MIKPEYKELCLNSCIRLPSSGTTIDISFMNDLSNNPTSYGFYVVKNYNAISFLDTNGNILHLHRVSVPNISLNNFKQKYLSIKNKLIVNFDVL